jgi:hypothetical protein
MSLTLFAPGMTLAQNLFVQSGEHRGFTRFVTRLPAPGTNWNVARQGRTATLTFEGFEGTFNTRRAFDLITRERVQDIAGDGDTLELALNCDCEVSAFTAEGRFVVIDVASPGVTLPTPFVAETVTETIETEEPETKETAEVIETPVLPIGSRNPLTDVDEAQTATTLNAPTTLFSDARDPLTEEEQQALSEMQQRLARELGAAATRGVLTPRPGATLPQLRRAQVDTSGFDVPEEIEERPAKDEMPPGVVNNMRITSSIDFPGFEPSDAPSVSISGAVCIPDEELDFASWADDSPFSQQLGPLREKLFGEFDRLNRKTAKKLVQLYLHFGFGAEARQVLNIDPAFAAKYPVLTGIAEIMENGSADDPGFLRTMLECDTDIALWAVLAEETLDVPQAIDPSASLRALNKLPVHLRRFLSPALSQRLLSHGDTDAAATALRSVERLPEELPPAAKLAKANVIIDEGDTDGGASKLEDVVDDNAPQSPQALIRLVETKLEANQPIDTETAGLVEAYAEELQETELGPDLRRAHVLALLKSSQFDRAFDAAKALGVDEETDEAVKLRLQLIREITAAAGDVVFLDHIFAQESKYIARLALRDKLRLAERLLSLGFSEMAQEVIATIPDRPRDTARQILGAQIALALEQPQLAQAALTELNSPEADVLRAEARAMSGAHDEAAQLFAEADQPQQAADAAWLAETLQSDALSDNPLFAPVIAISETDVAVSTQPVGMLARTNDALEESQNARAALADFLQDPALRIDTGEDAE